MITESPEEYPPRDDASLRVLLVEDNESFVTATRSALRILEPDMDLQIAHTLATAQEMLRSNQPFDLAVVDLDLPDAEELEAPSALRALAPGLVIVVLTGEPDPTLGTRLIRAGIEDYMTKADATPSSILLRMRLAAARRARRDKDERKLRSDPLTGCLNRRGLMEVLREARALADRFEIGSALCTLDLDGFKSVNDRYGHQAGDAVLVESSRRLSASIRETDALGRPGGDEFWVVLPGVHCTRRARETAERLLRCLEPPFPLPGVSIEITASIGMAMLTSASMSLDSWIKQSDVAMYRAKRAGGNLCELYANVGFRSSDDSAVD
ncbi:MAG: diguanylate cyclase [Woeseiaceae bacterium]